MALEIELPSGAIECRDIGDAGPVVVLLHGLLMDGTLWQEVAEALEVDHRCVVPTLPLGAHRRPLGPGADLSLRGVARLVVELLEHLDLRDVTLVGNDTGGAIAQFSWPPATTESLVRRWSRARRSTTFRRV